MRIATLCRDEENCNSRLSPRCSRYREIFCNALILSLFTLFAPTVKAQASHVERAEETNENVSASVAEAGAEATNLAAYSRLSGQEYLRTIEAEKAYEIFYDPVAGITQPVVIAVIDSGLDLRHENLREHLWVNRLEIPANGIDDDGNGYIDDVNGYNFASRLPSPAYEKSVQNSSWQYAHGTKVAGLALAITGAKSLVKIMPLNNMGRSISMDQADTARAIRYAVDNGADVINLSLGGQNSAATEYRKALRYAVSKGVVVLVAVGNEGMQITGDYSAAGVAPLLPGLISVGNFRAHDYAKSATSNYSSFFVKLAAPGTNSTSQGLLTTAPGGGFTAFSGTSAATPLVSGAAALAIGLIKSRGYHYAASEIEALLLDSALAIPHLAPFFREGKTLNLARLATLVDQRFPPLNPSRH
jgi:subtilisin family serine protease